jgi:putative Ca2+/H+ antiporter (TMEM165/GDT1 family)
MRRSPENSYLSSMSAFPDKPPLSPAPPSEARTFWAIFGSTFLTIFLAEMGDKTQLATLLMTAQSQSPWVVFAGSALALAATSLLGVTIGVWIARRLSPQRLDFGVALLLLAIAAGLVNDLLIS